MPLSPEDQEILKKPFGILVPDSKVDRQKISSIVRDAKKVIAVGDATTHRLVDFDIIPDVAVIDGKERRSTRSPPRNYPAKELRCINHAGTISQNALRVLTKSLSEKEPVRVLVEGEEDMLALPLFALSPLGTIVFYGQPLEGLVAVKITAAKRKQAKDLMERITNISVNYER